MNPTIITPFNTGRFQSALAAGLCALVLFCVAFARAATITWNGGNGTGYDLSQSTNWVGGVVPNVATPDVAQWDGSVAGVLSLTNLGDAYAGAAGNAGIDLSVTAGQTSSLSIDSGTNTSALRMNNLTIANGAGAFTMGDGLNTFNLTLGGAAGTHTWTSDSANTATINSDVTWGLGGGGTHTLLLTGAGNWIFNNIIGQGSGTLNVTKTGAGTATLTGANNFTGTTTVTLGTLTMSGSLATGAGAVAVNPASGTTATLNLTGSSFLRTGTFQVGTVAGGTGILNIGSGTTLNMSGGTSALIIGNAGFGVYNQTGGAVTSGQYLVAGITTAGAIGIMNISGGTYSPKTTSGGTVGATAGTIGQVNMSGTGSYTSTDTTANGAAGIYIGESGVGTLNVSGSATMTLGGVSTSSGLRIGVNSGAFGVVNLGAVGAGGGSITAMRVWTSNAGAKSDLNFHGGTLKAATGANSAFLNGLTVANVYGEGAVIDDNGQTIYIGQSLLAPVGNGVNSIASFTGGSGYSTAPYVAVSRGSGDTTGQFATALAQVDLNPVSGTFGQVTNVVITNPGINYTVAPTFTLSGGTPGAPATITGATPTANVSGGLTKNGSGTTILAGANTFTNTTTVNAGRLLLAGAQFSSRRLVINDGATLGMALPGSTQVAPANLTVGATTGATLNFTVSSTAQAPLTPGTLTFNGANTINIVGGTFVAGNSYPLIAYTTLAGSGSYAAGALPTGVGGTITTSGNTIYFNVTGVTNTIWTGAVNGTWDIATTANWTNTGTLGNTYIDGSLVQFDDTAAITTITNLSGTLSPGGILVSNITKNYTIKTNSVIAGNGGLIKTGTGSLTNSAVNTYRGPTVINQGAVVAGVASVANVSGALGNNSAVSLANDASAALNLNGFASQIGSLTGGGAVGGNVILGAGTLTVGGDNSSPAAFAGSITGTGGLTKIGTGTLTLSGTNAYSGATTLNGGALTYPTSAVINSLGAIMVGTGSGGAGSGGTCVVNVNGGAVSFGNVVSYVGYLTGNGILNLNGGTFACANDFRVGGSDVNGLGITNGYGTVNLSAGIANLSSLTIARGNNNQNGVSGEVNVSGGTLTSTNDLVIGYAGAGLGKLAISGTGTVNVGTTATKWLQFGQWDYTSSQMDINGGNLNLNIGTSIKYNTQNSSGTHTINQNGGAVTFYSDFATTVGGTGNLDLQYNASASTSPVNTYNLNGGTLTVPQVTSSAATCTRIFNFNGGTLKPTASSPTFFNLGAGNATANVRNNGAIIDSNGKDITIAHALVHSPISGDAATDGGLTKVGNGTLTMSGVLSYSGPTKVLGGTLSLNSSLGLPYGGDLVVSNATLVLDASSGSPMYVNNVSVGSALNLAVYPYANALSASGSLTLGANTTISLAYGTISGNPTAAAVAVSGGLTKGTNIVINLSATGLGVGVIPLITVGSGTMTTNGFVLGTLPSGVKGVLTNSASGKLDLLITSAGQLLTWRGASADGTILYTNWNINTDTNWIDAINYPNQLKYLQYSGNTIGDNVIFGDYGYNTDGTNHVNLAVTVVPATVVLSSSSPYALTGAGGIGGATSLVLTNMNNSVYLGTSNSYTGGTVVASGSLIITNDFALGASSGGVTLAGGTLQTAGSVTNARTIAITASSSIGVGASLITRLNGAVTGAGGLTKTDNGTLILAGTNDIAGSLQVSQGTLTTLGTNALPAIVRVGNTSSVNGVLAVSGGVFNANFNGGQFASSLIAGSTASSDGEIAINGGTLNVAQQLALGSGAGSYGALSIGSGALNCGSYIVVGFLGDMAVYNQRGGTVVLSSNLMTIGAGGGTTAVGVANFSGGTFVSSFPASSGIMVGERGTGTMTVSGTASIITTNSNGLLVGPVASQTGWSGTLNLNGGLVTANKINKGAGTGSAVVNLNGGTIKAAANNPTFLNGMDVATLYSGGLTVDDGGFAVTVPQTLTAAAGAGVSSITLNDGGSGYIDSPIVTISGGTGSNATATATVSGGVVTAIGVTSRGTGYNLGDSLSVSFAGGGANAVQPAGYTVNLSANTSGGVTKIGSGSVALTGNNNYTGNTVVGQGTLALSPTWQATNSDIVVSNAATLAVTATGGAVTYVHNLTAGAAGTDLTTLSFGLPAGNPASAVLDCRNLTLAGTNKLKIAGVLTAGTFPVLKYHGTFTGAGSLSPLASMPHGYSGVVSNDNATTTIYVTVSGAGGIVWQGYNLDPAKTNLWDVNLTTNWLSGVDLTTYLEGDKVVFDDTGSGTVLLSNTLSPSSVIISNAAVNYVFQGTGQITPVAGLTKLGSGAATLNVPGTYSVSTVVSNGTLSLGANQTFANLTGNGTVVTAAGTPTLTVNNTTNTTFAGSIQGGLGLSKSGNGTLTLTGTSAFSGNLFGNSGAIVIDGGTVNSGTLWTSIGQQGTDNATLTLKGTGSFTNNADFNVGDIGSATGTLNVSNSATLSVNSLYVASANAAGSTASGTVNQAGGTVQNQFLVIGGRTSTNAVGVYNLSGGTLTIASGSGGRIGNVGTGTLNISGTAAADFGSGTSYVGYRTGNGTLNMTGGSLSVGGDFRVAGSDASGTQYIATGLVTVANATVNLGSLTIARGNNYQNAVSGEVDINSGATVTSTNDVIVGFAGSGHAKLSLNGGTLNVATTVLKWFMLPEYDTTTGELDITNGALNLNAGSPIRMSSGNNTTGDNVINLEGGSITFYSDFGTTLGGGSLDLCAGSAGFTGNNIVNLDGGTLTVPQVTSSLANGTRIFNFNGGTLKPTGSSTTFFNLGSGSAYAYVRSGGAIINTAGSDVTIAQALLNNGVDEDGGLTKSGNGTLTLNGVNTYTNVTRVNGGTLGGTGTIAGAVVVNGGASLAPGASIGTLTINGNLTFDAGSTNVFEVDGTTPTNDVALVGANVTYGGVLQIVPSGTFTNGQAFTLFSGAGAVNAGNFASISGSPGTGLGFTFTNGVLRVVTVANPLSGLRFTATPVVSGTSLTITATNAGSGTAYLLTSTNVAAPLNTWTAIWTNVLTGSGSFTTNLPNAVNPAYRQQFYILSDTHN